MSGVSRISNDATAPFSVYGPTGYTGRCWMMRELHCCRTHGEDIKAACQLGWIFGILLPFITPCGFFCCCSFCCEYRQNVYPPERYESLNVTKAEIGQGCCGPCAFPEVKATHIGSGHHVHTMCGRYNLRVACERKDDAERLRTLLLRQQPKPAVRHDPVGRSSNVPFTVYGPTGYAGRCWQMRELYCCRHHNDEGIKEICLFGWLLVMLFPIICPTGCFCLCSFCGEYYQKSTPPHEYASLNVTQAEIGQGCCGPCAFPHVKATHRPHTDVKVHSTCGNGGDYDLHVACDNEEDAERLLAFLLRKQPDHVVAYEQTQARQHPVASHDPFSNAGESMRGSTDNDTLVHQLQQQLKESQRQLKEANARDQESQQHLIDSHARQRKLQQDKQELQQQLHDATRIPYGPPSSHLTLV